MKTIYGIALQTANYLGYQYEILPNTTLNEFHNVGNANTTGNPIVRYFTLGLEIPNEVTSTVDINGNIIENGVFNLNRNLHTVKHGNVFFPIPFLMLRAELALSDDESADYRLVKDISISGIDYKAYYLKKFSTIATDRYMDTITDSNNETTFTLFSSEDTSILSPLPQKDEFILADDIKGLAYSKPINMSLNQQELSNIIESVKLLYGEDREPIIGEILLCSGHDEVVDVQGIEAMGVQGNMFLEVDIDARETREDGVVITTEMGGMELMASVGL